MNIIKIESDQRLTWTKAPDPVAQANEVIIDIRAAGINRADLLQRAGKYPPPPGWPDWMGLEVAGVISYAEEGGRWRKGDRVCALLGGGGYAQKVAVPADMVLPVPDGLSFAEAAALPEAFATSYLNLCLEGELKAGDKVFIQAGASGLGMAAIQIAKTLGAQVITTVGSDDKVAFVKTLGADVAINRKKEDVAAVLAKYPVNIAMDCVAGANLGRYLETVARGCHWIVIATLGGSVSELNMNAFFRNGNKLIGSTLRSRSSKMKADILGGLENQLWPALAAGQIKSIIHKTLPITQTEQAHGILQRNENRGKVVLTVK